jgi:CelD/BcsL family acetyltransferase involved in cellulose biosynthesis
MTTPVTIELIRDRAAIPLEAAEWNALVQVSETNSVFQTYEWFDAWWQSFGRSFDLHFLVARRGTALVGFAALMRRRSWLGFSALEFVGSGNADYQDFILPAHEKPEVLGAMCRFIAQHAPRSARFRLRNIPGESSTLHLLPLAAAQAGLSVVTECSVPCPTLLLEKDRATAQKLVGKYSLRRSFNWFSKHGEVRFRHVSSVKEILAMLPVFFEQHMRRWNSVGKPSLFEGRTQQQFYERLVPSMHATGWLQFSVVEFNNEPIAFHFGFDYRGAVIWYKPSFDVRFADHSPGLLLTQQLIEDGLRRSRRELDFTIGDEAFKARFSSLQRHNWNLGVYRSAYLHRLAMLVHHARRLAGRVLRAVRGAVA